MLGSTTVARLGLGDSVLIDIASVVWIFADVIALAAVLILFVVSGNRLKDDGYYQYYFDEDIDGGPNTSQNDSEDR